MGVGVTFFPSLFSENNVLVIQIFIASWWELLAPG